MNQNENLKKDEDKAKEIRRLQYSENLGSLESFLIERYSGREDVYVFRTLQELPPNKSDQTPRDLRPKNFGKEINLKYSEAEILKKCNR